MKVLQRLAGCTALALTVAGAAAATATPAQAGSAVIPALSHVVASWATTPSASWATAARPAGRYPATSRPAAT